MLLYTIAVVTGNFACAFCLKKGLISKISYRYSVDFENLTVTHL